MLKLPFKTSKRQYKQAVGTCNYNGWTQPLDRREEKFWNFENWALKTGSIVFGTSDEYLIFQKTSFII